MINSEDNLINSEDKLNKLVEGSFISEQNSKKIHGQRMLRAAVVQSIYESEISKTKNIDLIKTSDYYENCSKERKSMAELIFQYAINNENIIDEKISEHIDDKNFGRISIVDLSILRMAISEMKVNNKAPVGVVVNEAVELANIFGSDSSKNFINGVLHSMVR